MRKLPWICPRCGGRNRWRAGACRRCRAKLSTPHRLELELLWAGALR